MKLIDILKTASGNILQSKLRTFLTVIAIFIGAFTLTLTNGIGAGISSYINQQVNSIGAKNVLFITVKAQSTTTTTSDAPDKYDPNQATKNTFGGQSQAVLTQHDLDVIKAQANIIDVRPQQNVSATYITASGAGKYQVSVGEYLDGTNLPLNAGSLPNNTSTQAQIVLPYNYPSVFGFSSDASAIGRTVTIAATSATGIISTVDATVVGVEEKTLIEGGSANVNTALFNALFTIQSEGLPAASLDKYPIAIAHFTSTLTDAQITTLKNNLSNLGYTAQTIQDEIGIIQKIISGIVIVFDIFAIITLIAASFGVINTLLMAVQERTKEIGLMKAMGMNGNRIFLLFSAEAILLGFWGSFIGVVGAVLVGKLANHIATTHFLQDFQGLNLLSFPLHTLVTIIVIIMIIAFLAGTLPARRAARLNPIDALRYE